MNLPYILKSFHLQPDPITPILTVDIKQSQIHSAVREQKLFPN